MMEYTISRPRFHCQVCFLGDFIKHVLPTKKTDNIAGRGRQKGDIVSALTQYILWETGNVFQQRQTYGQEDVLQTARHLPLNAILDVSSRNLLILRED